MISRDQRVQSEGGLAVLVVVFILVAVSLIGLVAYRVMSEKAGDKDPAQQINQPANSSTTFLGVVAQPNSCRNRETVSPCFNFTLKTEDGKIYGLAGRDLSEYTGKRVEIEGEVLESTNPSMLKVSSVKVVPEPTVKPKPNNTDFNATVFFSNVENGMTYERVQELAGGKSGDCAQTAVYPPSGNMSCTWSDANLRVTVHFTQNKAISKQKAEL